MVLLDTSSTLEQGTADLYVRQEHGSIMYLLRAGKDGQTFPMAAKLHEATKPTKIFLGVLQLRWPGTTRRRASSSSIRASDILGSAASSASLLPQNQGTLGADGLGGCGEREAAVVSVHFLAMAESWHDALEG